MNKDDNFEEDEGYPMKNEDYDDDDELYEELEEELEEIQDQIEELKEEIEDELRDKIADLRYLIEELKTVEPRRRYRHLQKIRIQLSKIQTYADTKPLKLEKFLPKAQAKVTKALAKAQKRRKPVERINISVPDEMSEEWRDWADGLSTSVSELVRQSMQFVKDNIGDLTKLDELGGKLDKMGHQIEQAVKNSGIEDIGEELGKQVEEAMKNAGLDESSKKAYKKGKKGEVHMEVRTDEERVADKEKAKKRIRGIIKLEHGIPIDKLANALKISEDDAENLIYELASEDKVYGKLNDERVFKFENDPDEIISILNRLIDEL